MGFLILPTLVGFVHFIWLRCNVYLFHNNCRFSLTMALLTLHESQRRKKMETNAYLEITLDIKSENRENAGGVYAKYKAPFLKQIKGATSKELLLRAEDVQVIHGFESEADAKAYLSSELFQK